MEKGDDRQAITQSMKNLVYAERYKETELMTKTYGFLAVIYQNMGNTRLRWFYLNKHATATKDSLILKAEWYEQHGNYARAWPYREKLLARARSRKVNTKEDFIYGLKCAATNLRKQGRLIEARQHLTEAFQVGKHNANLITMGSVWEEQALLDLQLGLPQAALQDAREAVRLTRLSKMANELVHCLATLSTVEEATGHDQQALRTYKEYKNLQDTLTSVEKTEALAQIQAQYESDKKENTIQLLNKNAQLQGLKAQQQQEALVSANRQRLLFGLVAFILLILMAIVGYFLQRLGQQKTELEHKTQQLQQTISLRDKLFSIISHDLRSPLANLLFSLSLFQRSRPQLKGLDDLERQVSAVYSTLDNLLYWSLSQQAGLRVRLVSLDLTDVITEVLDSFRSMIDQKGLVVTFTHDRYENQVLADENMTLICLRNIIHNAIKFTPSGGSICLSLEHHKKEVHLQVADSGIGLEDTSPILTKTKKSGQGTGLGLVVSEELMCQNKGSLSIASQLGKGVTVTLTFKAV